MASTTFEEVITPTTENLHDILVRARAIMAERGMIKGVLWEDPKRGPVCLRGALILASKEFGDPFGVLWNGCERIMGFTRDAAPVWNNAPKRTLEMVLERFDEAIEETGPMDPPSMEVPSMESSPSMEVPSMESPLDGTHEDGTQDGTRELVGV